MRVDDCVVFRMIDDAGAKGMAYHIFTEADLKKHSENRLMQRLLAVALLEVNLQECGINYAKELDPHSVFANRKFSLPEDVFRIHGTDSTQNRVHFLLELGNFESAETAKALVRLCGSNKLLHE